MSLSLLVGTIVVALANTLDQHQVQQNIGPECVSELFDSIMVFLYFFKKSLPPSVIYG